MKQSHPVSETGEVKVGPELNRRVAEEVMGDVLTVPRERAMAIVGASYVGSTGHLWTLDVHGYEIRIGMPPGESLPGHPTDDNWNQRYFRHAVAELLKYPNEIAELVERDIQACRLTPARYSESIADAWRVVEKMQEIASPRFQNLQLVVYCYNRTYATFDAGAFDNYDPSTWTETNGENSTPLAICLAALSGITQKNTGDGK